MITDPKKGTVIEIYDILSCNNKNIYHLIYIKETNRFNKIPYEKGKYNVYYLRYEVKSRMLRIYKYCYYVN